MIGFSRNLIRALLSLMIVSAIGGLSQSRAFAGQVHPGYQQVGSYPGVYYNYDFYNVGGTCPGANPGYADNPITLVFTGASSTMSTISSVLHNAGYASDNNVDVHCEYYSDQSTGSSWAMTSQGQGFRTPGCADTHVRLYGEAYSTSWGYYYLADTHQDRNDVSGCNGPKQFGWQEDAGQTVERVFSNQGWSDSPYFANFYNQIGSGTPGNGACPTNLWPGVWETSNGVNTWCEESDGYVAQLNH